MRKATRSDINTVVNIITETFDSNPGVNWLLKKKGSRKEKLRRLAKFAFLKSFVHDGVYIATNEKGVALCYRFDLKKFSWSALWHEVTFALTSIGLSRLPKVLKREAYRTKLRPTSGAYYYFWFLSVLPDGKGAAFELKNGVLKQAMLDNLPVYLETSVERNKKVYERMGFKTYHYWENEDDEIRFWFLKWEPATEKSCLQNEK